MTICECGCGQEVAIYRGTPRRFIRGHNNRGRKHTDITKQKTSEAMIGKNLGRKLSDKTKRKLSEISKRKTGVNASNWQGGVSFEPYCPKFNNSFKESIREKFDRVCFLCGKPEDDNKAKLSVHHVNYDKECLCSDIKCEFIPLCISCHSKTHHNRIYWENMILEKLEELN